MQARHDLVAFVHPPVVTGGMVAIYVARREDGTFLVGGHGFTDHDFTEFPQILFDDLVENDASLSELRDLPIGHCAMRRDRSEAWSLDLVPVGSTFLVRYDVRPSAAHPQRDEFGGAIVNCWLVASSLAHARTESHQHLHDSGWVIVDTLFAAQVSFDDLDQDEYARQARVDGLVAVFHTYPKDDLDVN